MTISDISADFPTFKKNLKRLQKLQRETPYLLTDDIKKTMNVVDLLERSSLVLRKVDNMDPLSNNLGELKPEPPVEMEQPPKSDRIPEKSAKVIAPKIKEMADVERDMSFTVPSIAPEENYASKKYTRLSENYTNGLKTEISNYNNRIKELTQGHKADWMEQSVAEFGRWTAAEQFRTRMTKSGLTGALEWLSDSIDQAKNGKLNVFEYLENEESGEFNNEFKDALMENDFYRDSYVNSLKNLYTTFYPQLYKSFIEESDDLAPDPIIKRALQDVPDIKNEEIAKKVLKQSVTDQLYRKYGEEQSKKLAKQINKYIDDNYSSLKLNEYRSLKTDAERKALLSEYADSDTIKNLLRLQGFRTSEVDKLSVDSVGERDYPFLINKFVAELKINPRFHNDSRVAETVASRLFGDEFEKNYSPELVDSYRRSNPHYIKHLVKHVNSLIDMHNESVPGNVRHIPYMRVKGEDGELKREDLEVIQDFFKMDGQRLFNFLDDNKISRDNVSRIYLKKLELMNRGGGLSFMTDSDNHAAIFLDNILTENRGMKETEHKRGLNYFSEGMAFFSDPRSEDNKLYMKELLNCPVFMDPQILSEALIFDDKNPKSSGKFRTMVQEILPLITGSYYKGRVGRNERKLMSAEQLAVEDYQNNPFVQRMKIASSSPENFAQFLEFFNGAMNDLGTYNGQKVSDIALSPGIEKFLRNSGEKPELDSKALEMQPIRSKTAYEKIFFRTPDQHINQMAELETKGLISEDKEIGASAKVFAFPIYKKYFNDFVNAYNERESGVSVEGKVGALRKTMLDDLNRKIAPTLFEDNRGVPYNYFANVYNIEDQEIKNGVLEALYILKKFDDDFYKRLLSAKVDKKGVTNPDLEPVVEQPMIQSPTPVETPKIETVPAMQTQVEEPKIVEEPKQEPITEDVQGPKEVGDRMRIQDQDLPTEVSEEDIPVSDGMEEAEELPEEAEEEIAEPMEYSEEDPGKAPVKIQPPPVVKGQPVDPKTRKARKKFFEHFKKVMRPMLDESDDVNYRKTVKALYNGKAVQVSEEGDKLIAWEKATDKDKRYTLFNALLQFSSAAKPMGMNPIGQSGKAIPRGGLDEFIPRPWLENAMKQYMALKPGDTLYKLKASPDIQKFGLDEFDYDTIDQRIDRLYRSEEGTNEAKRNIQRLEQAESEFMTGEENLKTEGEKAEEESKVYQAPHLVRRKEGGLRRASPGIGKTSVQMLRDSAQKLLEDKINSKFNPEVGERITKAKEGTNQITEFLIEAVDKAPEITYKEKELLKLLVKNIREDIGSGEIGAKDEGLTILKDAIDRYADRMELENLQVIDPIRQSYGYGTEEYMNRISSDKTLAEMTDLGRISRKPEFLQMLVDKLNENADLVHSTIGEEKLKLISDPSIQDFKFLAKNFGGVAKELIEEKLNSLKKDMLKQGVPEEQVNKEMNEIRKPVDDYFDRYVDAMIRLDVDSSNTIKDMLIESMRKYMDLNVLGGPIVLLRQVKTKEGKERSDKVSSILNEEIRRLNLEITGLANKMSTSMDKNEKKELKLNIKKLKETMAGYKNDMENAKAGLPLETQLGKEASEIYTKGLIEGVGEKREIPQVPKPIPAKNMENSLAQLEMVMNSILDAERAKGNPIDPLKETMLDMVMNIKDGNQDDYERNKETLNYLFGYDTEGEEAKAKWFGRTDELMRQTMGE